MRKFLTRTEARLERFPGIEFRLTLGRGLDRVSVDPTQFLVAATQLVNNAVEAIEARAVPLTSPESRLPQSLDGAHVSGTIEVQLQRVEPSGWSLSVTDNGLGIEPRVAEHLFDPFFSGREAGRGLGFGFLGFDDLVCFLVLKVKL